MTLMWQDVQRDLEQRVEQFEAVWALIWHAQMGVLVLSLVEPLDQDLNLSDAADTLGLALTELERVRPELEFLCLPGEPGRVPLDDISGYRTGIDSLLNACAREIARMLREDAAELQLNELVVLATVSSLVGEARRRIAEPLR